MGAKASEMAIDEELRKKLLDEARTAKQGAYAIYSGVSVGAAVLTEDGAIVRGANIENASQTLNCCAERTAIYTAIAGRGRLRFRAIAISVSSEDGARRTHSPCGACRQVMAEFMDDDAPVIVDGGRDYTVGELLPDAFRIQR
jgi:cytidine deaminase